MDLSLLFLWQATLAGKLGHARQSRQQVAIMVIIIIISISVIVKIAKLCLGGHWDFLVTDSSPRAEELDAYSPIDTSKGWHTWSWAQHNITLLKAVSAPYKQITQQLQKSKMSSFIKLAVNMWQNPI